MQFRIGDKIPNLPDDYYQYAKHAPPGHIMVLGYEGARSGFAAILKEGVLKRIIPIDKNLKIPPGLSMPSDIIEDIRTADAMLVNSDDIGPEGIAAMKQVKASLN